MTEKYDDRLEALFEAARLDDRAVPNSDFLARVLEDATALQPAPEALATPARRGGFLAQLTGDLTSVFGGWRPMAGLAVATLAGVWIGFSGMSLLPDGLNGLFGATNEIYLADLEFGVAFDAGEG